MAASKIEWTELTWNPVTGCDKISAGCKFCYAELMAKRLKAMGVPKYMNEFRLTLHDDVLQEPYTWRGSKIVFVNSMSDLFHKDVPVDFIQRAFKVMNENPQHVFQVLTKRADILYEYDRRNLLKWTHNIWMGVSVENSKVKERIKLLRQTKAKTKFLSIEPLIGSLGRINLKKIDWVIVGGESGRKPRPMNADWVLSLQEQCEAKGVAFFFKQWGGTNKKKAGRELNGQTWDEMPEFPDSFQSH